MNRIKRTTKTITNTILLNTNYLLAQLKKCTTRKNNETRNNLLLTDSTDLKINIHSLNGILMSYFFTFFSWFYFTKDA